MGLSELISSAARFFLLSSGLYLPLWLAFWSLFLARFLEFSPVVKIIRLVLRWVFRLGPRVICRKTTSGMGGLFEGVCFPVHSEIPNVP